MFLNYYKSFIINEDNGWDGERFNALVTYKHVCLSNTKGFRPILPNSLAVSVDAIHLCMIANGKLFYYHPTRKSAVTGSQWPSLYSIYLSAISQLHCRQDLMRKSRLHALNGNLQPPLIPAQSPSWIADTIQWESHNYRLSRAISILRLSLCNLPVWGRETGEV